MSEAEVPSTDPAPHTAWLRQGAFWRAMRFVMTPFFLFWARTHAIGTENIDNTKGGLLLLNHQSYLDPMVAAFRLTRPVSFMARDGLFQVPFVSWVLRHTWTMAISQTAFRGSSIRAAVARMEEGFLVGIFPEGERNSGEVRRFNRGFLSLVRRVDLPIYPVGIVGADRVMPRGSALIRPGRITVVYGQPLTPEEIDQLRHGTDDHQLAEMVRLRVADCMAQATPAPRKLT